MTASLPAGGAALLLEPGNRICCGWVNCTKLAVWEIDPLRGDRMDYLNKLGLAYLNAAVPPQHLLQPS